MKKTNEKNTKNCTGSSKNCSGSEKNVKGKSCGKKNTKDCK